MPFVTTQEVGGSIAIKDEGITIAAKAGSVDLVGSGVTGTAIGNAVTQTIPGGGGSAQQIETPSGTIDGSNRVFTTANVPLFMTVNGQAKYENATGSAGYTRVNLTLTLGFDVFPGDVLRSHY